MSRKNKRADLLPIVVNKSFRDGLFSENLKIAVLKPILKKGDTLDLSDYRPVTLITNFCKKFRETIVKAYNG